MVLQIYSVPKIIDMRLKGGYWSQVSVRDKGPIRFEYPHLFSNPQDNSMCVSNKHSGSRVIDQSLMTAIVLRTHATF